MNTRLTPKVRAGLHDARVVVRVHLPPLVVCQKRRELTKRAAASARQLLRMRRSCCACGGVSSQGAPASSSASQSVARPACRVCVTCAPRAPVQRLPTEVASQHPWRSSGGLCTRA